MLADPERFEGVTLADPLEGVDYGRCKARIMRRGDGTTWINSFAHGHTIYELKHNSTSVRAAMAAASDSAVVKAFLKFALAAELSAEELEELRNEAAKRSGKSPFRCVASRPSSRRPIGRAAADLGTVSAAVEATRCR